MKPTLLGKLNLWYIDMLNTMHRPAIRKGENDPYHQVLKRFHELAGELDSPAFLEIGSRNGGEFTRKHFSDCGKYVGLDILPGKCVDVVGDAHKLSDYFEKNTFDLVYSTSVFEHLMFPWKAVLEINKIMKTGGYFYCSTHPTWPTHELPWDFWRFMINSFDSLFNKYTGFEIVHIAEGLPLRGYSLVDDLPTRNNCHSLMSQGVAVIARKTADYREDLLKWDIDIFEVVETMYPSPH